MLKVYQAMGWNAKGKTGVKISTGEPPASNYLRPALLKDTVQAVDGTIVECNTAYGGSRASNAMHKQVAEDHVEGISQPIGQFWHMDQEHFKVQIYIKFFDFNTDE